MGGGTGNQAPAAQPAGKGGAAPVTQQAGKGAAQAQPMQSPTIDNMRARGQNLGMMMGGPQHQPLYQNQFQHQYGQGPMSLANSMDPAQQQFGQQPFGNGQGLQQLMSGIRNRICG